MKQIIIILILSVITFILYLFKDSIIQFVPDNNYSDAVIRNKGLVIGAMAIIGIVFIILTRKKE
jgi:uncharacterized membrane protein